PMLGARYALRFHIAIESDHDRRPGLSPSTSSVAHRLEAAAQLRAAGLRIVITVSPLLLIEQPKRFFLSLRAAPSPSHYFFKCRSKTSTTRLNNSGLSKPLGPCSAPLMTSNVTSTPAFLRACVSNSLWCSGTIRSWSPCMMRKGGASFVTYVMGFARATFSLFSCIGPPIRRDTSESGAL